MQRPPGTTPTTNDINDNFIQQMVDPANISIIVNFPPPKSVKHLLTILGFIGYYRNLIKGYAHITAPMGKLLKKDMKFEWDEDCQK